jgi:hypothetical protein
MLRGDLLVYGTSTTGTGTSTLPATPVPGGFDSTENWLRQQRSLKFSHFLIDLKRNSHSDVTLEVRLFVFNIVPKPTSVVHQVSSTLTPLARRRSGSNFVRLT